MLRDERDDEVMAGTIKIPRELFERRRARPVQRRSKGTLPEYKVWFFEQGVRKVVKPELGPCLLWTRAKDADGYGVVGVHWTMRDRYATTTSAHRMSFMLTHGRWPKDGYVVTHECDQPACFEPTHVTEGPQDENIRQMVERGRHVSARAGKISGQDDLEIVLTMVAGGHKQTHVAMVFGVTSGTISRLVNGKSQIAQLAILEERRPGLRAAAVEASRTANARRLRAA